MVETIPSFGLGTFRVDAEKTVNSVKSALQLGYRHIDTAKFYNNEESVGKGVRDSGIPREDIWVTTKVWHDQLRREDVVKSLVESHKKLNIGTIDLALVPWPSPDSVVPIAETIAFSGSAWTARRVSRVTSGRSCLRRAGSGRHWAS